MVLARLAFLLLAAGAALGCSGSQPNAPNLLLITVDTLRPDRLSCYDGPENTGTGLCSLASRGRRYEWAFSTAPSTAPSIASILTSRYPSQHGVSQFATTFLPEEETTLAEHLQGAGYATAAFVSNPVIGSSRKLDQGFEIYDDRMTRRERNRPGLEERVAAATTDAALAWAGVAPKPWFLWVHFQDPHGPYDPPHATATAEAPGGPRLPFLSDHSGRGGVPAYQVIPGLETAAGYEARYREEIRYLDVHLSRLLAGLDATGEPLGVLLTADHAEAFGEDDYWFAHGHSVGVDQIRVPLLWRPPGGTDPDVPLDPVSTLDVAPTLLRAAGQAVPDGLEGRPLQDPPDPGRQLLAEHRLRLAVVSGRRYFGRDRLALEAPVPDRISGGLLHPLPPRSARLGSDGRPSAYEVTSDPAAEPLEVPLARWQARHAGAAARGAVELGPDMRERLRALGYLE